MRNRKDLAIAILLGVFACSGLLAQNKIDWNRISNGAGTRISASYKLSATIGQPTVGFVKGSNSFEWVGFWSGSVPTPSNVPDIVNIKTLADGTIISTSGKIATSAVGDFDQFLYVEDGLRSNGIRVAVSPGAW